MDLSQTQSSGSPGFRVLILEDDPICAKLVAGIVEAEGGEPVIAPTIAAAKAEAQKHQFDLLFLDYQLPDGLGSDFFYAMREQGYPARAIMLTAFPTIATAVELTRDGLFDYVTKPFEPEDLASRFRQAIRGLVRDEPEWGQVSLAGRSSAMQRVRRLTEQAAANPAATVLLTGETGTGKDLTARVIHELTFKRLKPLPPFMSLSCPALPSDMFEAELFGAEKGAYTGAYQQREGLVQAASNGTLFLDEISEVPIQVQAKLLQFLETRTYRRLASTQTRQFTGRVIAASNRSLLEEVKQGRFRQDLLYRLDVLAIQLPPLRDHVDDLDDLIEMLLQQLADKYERRRLTAKPTDVAVLKRYDFPGNVRELRNLLERSLLHSSPDSHWLQIDPMWLAQASLRIAEQPAASATPTVQPELPGRGLSALEAQEYELVRQILVAEKGVIRRAAARLGISHQSLLRRLEKWPELRRLIETPRPADGKSEAGTAVAPG